MNDREWDELLRAAACTSFAFLRDEPDIYAAPLGEVGLPTTQPEIRSEKSGRIA